MNEVVKTMQMSFFIGYDYASFSLDGYDVFQKIVHKIL